MSKLKDKQFKTKGELFPFMKRMLGYCFKYPKIMYSFIACVLVVAAVEAVYPVVWKNLIDNAIMPILSGTAGADSKEILIKYFIIFFLLGVTLACGVFGFINFAGRIMENIMFDLRQKMFRKLQELSFSYYDKSATGWLISRISLDAVKVTELISWAMIELIWGIGMITFCVIVMFILNWKLALVVTISLPFLAFISIKIRMLILRFSREARKTNSEITASFNEHINGVEVNKSLGQEERVSEMFSELSEKMRLSSYKSAYYSAIYTPLVIFGGSVSAVFVIYYGGIMTLGIQPDISVGMLAAFFGFATSMFEPILDISRFYSQAQNSISAGERIFSLLETEPVIKDKYGASSYENIFGEIEFKDVSFSYVEGIDVLKNFNLKINAGESVALVGETGGGKSTIINLICRFYEPTSGNLLIDGIDYKEMTTQSLRQHLGIVLQTPHLFSGTIHENIKVGKPDAADEEIMQALLTSGGEELVDRLHEQVGEAGENLSLGEKQIISFARAMIKDPSIFIMDEATSSLDTLTEHKIQKGIEGLVKDRTSIIIAHRLSTIRNCDRIIVIIQGRVTEHGNHYELMRAKGHYYNLYTRQLRKEREKELMNT